MNHRFSAALLAVFTLSLFSFFRCERELDGLVLDQWTIGSGTNTFSKSYYEPDATVYVFRLKGNSLCAIYGVKAKIAVNGMDVMNKTYADAAVQTTDEVTINIPAGSDVQVITERYNTGSLVQCVWGGEAKFELERK